MHFGHGHGGFGHGGFGHWGHRHFGSSFYAGGSCYKTIFTAYGPRTVNVCDSIY
jgi:hypothetical protein